MEILSEKDTVRVQANSVSFTLIEFSVTGYVSNEL